jgi:hypothetical protein
MAASYARFFFVTKADEGKAEVFPAFFALVFGRLRENRVALGLQEEFNILLSSFSFS